MDSDFEKRRAAGRKQVDALEKESLQSGNRQAFFSSVYQNADADEAAVPWADMKPKEELVAWLKDNGPHHGSAIDIGCGLGDNAEALAGAGYKTVGFDFSEEAIDWAKQRFPQSAVQYQSADLLNLPQQWVGAFDLVHECYTLQSIPPETLAETIPATALLVAPGGALLVYARIREDGAHAEGPPWPVEKSKLKTFSEHGLSLERWDEFSIERPGRTIPHLFSVWRRQT